MLFVAREDILTVCKTL